MEEDILKNIWPEWKIVDVIGEGNYGVVYKAVREEVGFESTAAIKVITVPKSKSEINTVRSEGHTEDDTKKYFKGLVDEFVSEIKLMDSLKGITNIVSIEDYKVIEHIDEIGWTIYIRMELLTPLTEYVNRKLLTEKQVIKLGCDICTALEICQQKNIIHRDIKPQNIFVNSNGDFKLGDFGVARSLEVVTSGLSKKGTPNYMAPEVWSGTDYDERVDIYSLGLVLYRYLNKNHLPFQDIEKSFLTSLEQEKALTRRLNGEVLPKPCEASDSMANIILKACQPIANNRYQTPTEMKRDLLAVKNGEEIESSLDKTISVRKASSKVVEEEPVKKIDDFTEEKLSIFKIAMIIVLAILIGGLGGAVIWLIPQVLAKDTDETKETKVIQVESSSSKNTEIASTQEQTSIAETTQTLETEKTQLQSKYQIVTGYYNWEEADSKCMDMGGHLVHIDDYKEWKYLTETFIPSQKVENTKFLIGGKREEDSTDYFWVTEDGVLIGNPLNSYNSWINQHDLWFYSSIQTQPSFYDSETNEGEYYLQIFYIKDTESNRKKGRKLGWSFNDVSISEEMSFICEFD